MEGVTVGEKREDRNTEVRITYRFDPPDGRDGEQNSVVDAIRNGSQYTTTKRATISSVRWTS